MGLGGARVCVCVIDEGKHSVGSSHRVTWGPAAQQAQFSSSRWLVITHQCVCVCAGCVTVVSLRLRLRARFVTVTEEAAWAWETASEVTP